MIEQKRFGRTVGLHSTAQIVRELEIITRHDTAAWSSRWSGQSAPASKCASVDAR